MDAKSFLPRVFVAGFRPRKIGIHYVDARLDIIGCSYKDMATDRTANHARQNMRACQDPNIGALAPNPYHAQIPRYPEPSSEPSHTSNRTCGTHASHDTGYYPLRHRLRQCTLNPTMGTRGLNNPKTNVKAALGAPCDIAVSWILIRLGDDTLRHAALASQPKPRRFRRTDIRRTDKRDENSLGSKILRE